MKYYETLYLLNPNLAAEEYGEIVGKFTDVVGKNGGEVIRVDEWGKKSLAYEVKRFDRGYYVLLSFCGESGITTPLHRELRLDDRVLKYQTVKLSDQADPEELKAKAAEQRPRPAEAAEAPEPITFESDEEHVEDREGENG
jgi:small subunit ribosomal protein S6